MTASEISSWIAPVLMLATFLIALVRRKDAYAAFVRGARRGLETAVSILPYVAAMLILSEWVRVSGLLTWLEAIFSPLLRLIGIDKNLTAFALLRPFSGSGALALLSGLCETYGANSREAFTAAVMMGSTETLFYTFSLYFGAAGVKKTRYAMLAAVRSTLAGYAAAAFLCARIL